MNACSTVDPIAIGWRRSTGCPTTICIHFSLFLKVMKSPLYFLLMLILLSCGEKTGFEVPQPETLSDEKKLPKKMIGQYLNVKDSSMLSFTPGEIVKVVIADFATHKSELDSSEKLIYKNDTSYAEVDFNMKVDVMVKGDSVFQHLDYRDTIFSFRSDILRKFRGHYFLNHRTSPNNWTVTTLTTTKKGLTLGTVSTKDDIEKLRDLTEAKSDSVYTFHPTKKQLKQFLKEGGFSHEEIYVKIK